MKNIFDVIKFKKKSSVFLITFGKSGNAAPFLKDGWRQSEENQQWSVGHFGRIIIPKNVLSSNQKKYLVLKLSSFVLQGKHDRQTVQLIINDKLIEEIIFDSNRFILKSYNITNVPVTNKDMEILFNTPDSISPFEIGVNDDKDKLGVCLMYIGIATEDFLCSEIYNERSEIISRKYSEYNQLIHDNRHAYVERQIYENALLVRKKNINDIHIDGYCEACEQTASFLISENIIKDENVHYREQLICSHCQLKNRQRYVVSRLKQEAARKKNQGASIYLYEQHGDFFKFLTDNLRESTIIGSEYLGHGIRPGTLVNGIRHENALNLSFADETFDYLVSCDVFEHVPDIHVALSESFRVLRKGGILIFTIPFDSRSQFSVLRSQVDKNGNVRHLLDPVYHGNPIDSLGSLVFYDFGWDVVGKCIDAGFSDCYSINYWSPHFAYLGSGELFCFVASKK